MKTKDSLSASDSILVQPVRGRKMLNEFIQLAWTMNAGDPQWVPPLRCEVREFLDEKHHPFYEYGTAEKFVAYRNGVPAGRILVSDNPLLNNRKKTNWGAWGMFECANDLGVARALFDAAKKWSYENHGRTTLLGPIDYSTTYGMGLLVDGFDTPPRYSMNHNPAYYKDLVQKCGMACVQGMCAWWFPVSESVVLEWEKRIEWITRRTKIEYRPLNPKNLEEDIALCRDVYNNSMRDNWNYSELTEREMEHTAHQLVQFAHLDQVFLAMDGEKPVGFVVTIPDLNEAIRPMNGRVFPFGIFKFLYHKRKIKTGRCMILCVDPNYRRRGISEMLIIKIIKAGLKYGYVNAELGWTYRDNEAVNRIIRRIGAIPYKSYDLYECPCVEE